MRTAYADSKINEREPKRANESVGTCDVAESTTHLDRGTERADSLQARC